MNNKNNIKLQRLQTANNNKNINDNDNEQNEMTYFWTFKELAYTLHQFELNRWSKTLVIGWATRERVAGVKIWLANYHEDVITT